MARVLRPLDPNGLLGKLGQRLTAEQRSALTRIDPNKYLEVASRLDGDDLVIELITEWSLKHGSGKGWRDGNSYNRRIHKDGLWCQFGQNGHVPCSRCSGLADMQGAARNWPDLRAPESYTPEQLDAHWRRLCGAARVPRPDRTQHARRERVAFSSLPDFDEANEYRTEAELRTAHRRERELVSDFLSFLGASGRTAAPHKIRVAGGHIECDIIDSSQFILFEAKADADDRDQLRRAIGQLFDYRHFGFSARERECLRLAILLPARPHRELVQLLASLRIGVCWRTAPGRFEERHVNAHV